MALTLNATDAAQPGQRNCSVEAVRGGRGFVTVAQDTTDGVCTRQMNLCIFMRDKNGKYGGTIYFPK